MFNERAFVARVEAAGTEQFARLVLHPTIDEEKALRAYLGDDRYQRVHSMALRQNSRQARGTARGNVVVVHGFLGSELSAVDKGGNGEAEQIWPSALRIMAGRLDRLRLAEDGLAEFDAASVVRPTGILKRHYGELLLSLCERWDARAFWYDWRKDLRYAAATLEAQINGWFGASAPVHIVAHGVGGLVARTFIKSYPEHWEAMWDKESSPPGRLGGRLVMLGTPNRGTFSAPQVITGLQDTVRKLSLLDHHHSLRHLLDIVSSFVGLYQLLPSPTLKNMAALYQAETYGERTVSQRHLTNAAAYHRWLEDPAGTPDAAAAARLICIAGDNRPTYCDITDIARLKDEPSFEHYEVTLRGDGCVPLSLARLSGGESASPIYHVDEDHGGLSSHEGVLAAVEELLETGQTRTLSGPDPSATAGPGGAGEGAAPPSSPDRGRGHADEDDRLATLIYRLRSRGTDTPAPGYLTFEERETEEILTRHFLSFRTDEGQHTERRERPEGTARIEIGLVHGSIAGPDYQVGPDGAGDPVDAISVGHYVGVKPQAAEAALDRSLSAALQGTLPPAGAVLPDTDLLLARYTERGIIRGDLGQPFFLPDPRTDGPDQAAPAGRVIAIAGMGLPGRFGVPELTVMARELCWSLGYIGKRHLATVLIGAGNGNLQVEAATEGWFAGIAQALAGAADGGQRRLTRITFFERSPRRVQDIHAAIAETARRMKEENELLVEYRGLGEAQIKDLQEQVIEAERREWEARWARGQPQPVSSVDPTPTRVTLTLEGKTYRFGAITAMASIPERAIPVDPALVSRANDELAAERDPARQLERGQFMERLLVPADLRPQLSGTAPLVMLLDATTASIHWEMVAQFDLTSPSSGSSSYGDSAQNGALAGSFLGTSRGFTRQLRTMFAPPPEPPPPPRRLLRVLVVADPAEDAHLPGAEEEGVEVADLFTSFNTVWKPSDNRIEVVRLFGPREATRTNVLRHLMMRSFDVLHFAGHCLYDRADPALSGWIFTGGERLTAAELTRVDRIPKFVFSNACESGITSDRSEMRSVELAPSFAEAFFARGVSNFVCTAWPVNDAAARLFALTLYSALIGLSRSSTEGTRAGRAAVPPEPMHAAMREARLEVARNPYGAWTWGAYQHYGDPYFRLFSPITLSYP